MYPKGIPLSFTKNPRLNLPRRSTRSYSGWHSAQKKRLTFSQDQEPVKVCSCSSYSTLPAFSLSKTTPHSWQATQGSSFLLHGHLKSHHLSRAWRQ